MAPTPTDWRLPENRREAFQRAYSFHLKYKTHPGCVYFLLPHIAEALELDDDQRAWLVWLNGNTQNPAMSLLLLEAAPRPTDWRKAVDFWNEHFKLMEWDTDRRHQKSKFGEATAAWADLYGLAPAEGWRAASRGFWSDVWDFAKGQPFMGRLSAWSMTEYARILFGHTIPDAEHLMLLDGKGSHSHRNGLGLVAGYDATYWTVEEGMDHVGELWELGQSLLEEAEQRNRVDARWGTLPHPDVSYLTLESALCTYKSWHKPGRRYPNVYADMAYLRLKKAEARFGPHFDILWEARQLNLPHYLRLEDNPYDPGLHPLKQDHYRKTGEIPLLGFEWDDMPPCGFDVKLTNHAFGLREDPTWT